ncbi:ribonuclease h2 non-catalytic subunit [Hirsutella rhossiliensis]
MPEPMLAVEDHKLSRETKAVPNLLPCRLHHTGSAAPVSEYWTPIQADDSTSIAYFRGRKLRGRTLPLPDDYQGVVVERKSQEQANKQSHPQEHDQQGAGGVETDTLQVTTRFDKVLVWSHEASTDPATDPYVRGMDEWLQVAGKVRTLGTEKGQD